jgi:hypothetical protein
MDGAPREAGSIPPWPGSRIVWPTRSPTASRLTRQVGGSDLGRLLGTLAEFLRESARTRSELEARQSWTVNAARLAVAAPRMVLMWRQAGRRL